MADAIVYRNIELDISFALRTAVGGTLRDDDQWIDGLTAAQWPTVVFKNSGGTDVTSSFVKNISGDTVNSPKMKHPDPSTGQIRDSVGLYRVRVKPQVALALGEYTMTVTADIGGAPYFEIYTIALTLPGDIELGSGSVYCTEDDVLSNFELESIVTSTEVLKARVIADRCVNTLLQKDGISTPHSPVIPALTQGAIAFARADLRRLKAKITGAGLGVKAIREGDTEFQFVSGDSQYRALYDEGVQWTEFAIDAILGKNYFGVTSRGQRDD